MREAVTTIRLSKEMHLTARWGTFFRPECPLVPDQESRSHITNN